MTNPNKKNKRKINKNGVLVIILMVTALCTVVAFGINIYRVASGNSGEGETVETEAVENEYQNAQYSIGNNPTEINKEYFLELNDALDGKAITNEDGTSVEGDEAIAQSVVKCFIAQYYTWTNKDGNYDIGGMQYIYTPKQSDFETYTLYNFYEDMDLYISQYGRDNLIEVESVTINSLTTGEYTVASPTDDSEVSDGSEAVTTTLSSVDVDATWTYVTNDTIDTSEFQNHAVFHVVNNDGRWEIGGIDDGTVSEEAVVEEGGAE